MLKPKSSQKPEGLKVCPLVSSVSKVVVVLVVVSVLVVLVASACVEHKKDIFCVKQGSRFLSFFLQHI